MTILDISFFNFWNSTKSISSEALNPLKTISDDSIWHPKGHPSIPRKSQNLQFFGFWPCLVLMDSICMLWRHVYAVETWYMLCGHAICSMDMSSCWRRIYGVFLLEKNIWIWKMSSCWIMVGTVEPSMYQWIRLDYNALLEWIMVMVMVMVFKTFEGALRLAAGAFFFWKKTFSWKNDIS